MLRKKEAKSNQAKRNGMDKKRLRMAHMQHLAELSDAIHSLLKQRHSLCGCASMQRKVVESKLIRSASGGQRNSVISTEDMRTRIDMLLDIAPEWIYENRVSPSNILLCLRIGMGKGNRRPAGYGNTQYPSYHQVRSKIVRMAAAPLTTLM